MFKNKQTNKKFILPTLETSEHSSGDKVLTRIINFTNTSNITTLIEIE